MSDVDYTITRSVTVRSQRLRFEQTTYVPSHGEEKWPRTVTVYSLDDVGNKEFCDTRSMSEGDDDLEAFASRYIDEMVREQRDLGLI